MARMAMERNGLYGLLASVFREELSADLLNHLLSPDFLEGLAAVGVDVAALSALEPDDALLESLSIEFSRLFVGPGKHVPPYESVHLGGDGGTLWGPETSTLKRFIEQAGFKYDEKFHGLPDHISVELEFMAHLTGQEADFWREKDQEKAINCLRFQKDFLDRHLGRWVGLFLDEVTELAEFPIYQQMAYLAQNFVAAESDELSSIDDLEVLSN